MESRHLGRGEHRCRTRRARVSKRQPTHECSFNSCKGDNLDRRWLVVGEASLFQKKVTEYRADASPAEINEQVPLLLVAKQLLSDGGATRHFYVDPVDDVPLHLRGADEVYGSWEIPQDFAAIAKETPANDGESNPATDSKPKDANDGEPKPATDSVLDPATDSTSTST